jgi:hypothetical protein
LHIFIHNGQISNLITYMKTAVYFKQDRYVYNKIWCGKNFSCGTSRSSAWNYKIRKFYYFHIFINNGQISNLITFIKTACNFKQDRYVYYKICDSKISCSRRTSQWLARNYKIRKFYYLHIFINNGQISNLITFIKTACKFKQDRYVSPSEKFLPYYILL